MTERYAHVAPENAEAAVAKLDAVPKIYPLDGKQSHPLPLILPPSRGKEEDGAQRR
jgi:hypothetical protein